MEELTYLESNLMGWEDGALQIMVEEDSERRSWRVDGKSEATAMNLADYLWNNLVIIAPL